MVTVFMATLSSWFEDQEATRQCVQFEASRSGERMQFISLRMMQ